MSEHEKYITTVLKLDTEIKCHMVPDQYAYIGSETLHCPLIIAIMFVQG